MSFRDHPFNRSTRPLLERKNHHQHHQHHHHQQQQPQPQSQSIFKKKYDTKIRGFNDFNDFKQYSNSDQYYSGYPYGSPPSSPVNNKDFQFSDDDSGFQTIDNNISNSSQECSTIITTPNYQHHHQSHRIPQSNRYPPHQNHSQPQHHHHPNQQSNYYSNDINNLDENDFDYEQIDGYNDHLNHQWENSSSSKTPIIISKKSTITKSSGPFIFGIDASTSSTPIIARNQINHDDNDDVDDGDYDDNDDNEIVSSYQPSTIINSSSYNNNQHIIRQRNNNNNNNNNCHLNQQNTQNSLTPVIQSKTQHINHNNTNNFQHQYSRESIIKVQNDKHLKIQSIPNDKRLLKKSKSKSRKKDKENKAAQTNGIKCVLVGDGAVGKTNLICSYLENRFNDEHVPTASDMYNFQVNVNDHPVQICLCDTAGQDSLDPLRQLSYPDSDIFMLCFSVIKPVSFESIKSKWIPKFTKSSALILLIGTQSDLRNDPKVLSMLKKEGEVPISMVEAWDLATSIGAKYIETSSLFRVGVKDAFDTAIWEAMASENLTKSHQPFWKKMLCLV